MSKIDVWNDFSSRLFNKITNKHFICESSSKSHQKCLILNICAEKT